MSYVWPPVLTAAELCTALRLSRAQYQRLKKAGRLPVPALPGLDSRARYSAELVRRYLAGDVVLPARGRR